MSWMGLMAADGTGGGLPPVAAPKGTYNQQPVGMGGAMAGTQNNMLGMIGTPGQQPQTGIGYPGQLNPAGVPMGGPDSNSIGFSGVDPMTGAGYSGEATPGQSAFPDNTTQPPSPTPEAPKGEGFDWMSLLQQNGGSSMPPINAPRGSQTTTPKMVVDPRTGLIRWEGGTNVG